mgnify:CR=1 FL=1
MKYYIDFTSIYDREVFFSAGPIDEETRIKFNSMCTVGQTRWVFMPLASGAKNSKVTITKEMIPKFVIVITPVEEDQE